MLLSTSNEPVSCSSSRVSSSATTKHRPNVAPAGGIEHDQQRKTPSTPPSTTRRSCDGVLRNEHSVTHRSSLTSLGRSRDARPRARERDSRVPFAFASTHPQASRRFVAPEKLQRESANALRAGDFPSVFDRCDRKMVIAFPVHQAWSELAALLGHTSGSASRLNLAAELFPPPRPTESPIRELKRDEHDYDRGFFAHADSG